MKKYKKIRVTFEEKVFNIKRKPIYATRKLSVGLVSCMLGFMMFMPTVKAVEEDPIPKSQQAQDKNEVLDKTDDFVQEKEDITPLYDQTDSKVDSEENLSDQNLDGQNKEEDIIKEENTDSNLENKDEELLTADEIQAIRNRANSLENDYFFNDNMVEELKAELRKAKADPSVNYEEAKARLIDEAIQKNAPTQKAPGEVRAKEKPLKAPKINTVSIGDKVIKGSGAPSIQVKGKRVYGTVYVSLVDSKGYEKANGSFTRKGYSGNWKVTLSVAAAEGDKVIAYSVVDNRESPRAEVEVKKTLNIINKDKLKMPTGEIWIADTSSNLVSEDEKAEAKEMFDKVNSNILKDIKSVGFSIDGTTAAYYQVTYTDNSKSEKIIAPDLKIKKITEKSQVPEIQKTYMADGHITIKFKEKVKKGTKIGIAKNFDGSDGDNFRT